MLSSVRRLGGGWVVRRNPTKLGKSRTDASRTASTVFLQLYSNPPKLERWTTKSFGNCWDWYGYSWKGYRRVRKGVKKTYFPSHAGIGMPIRERLCESFGRTTCTESPEASSSCPWTISRFFRDRSMWNALDGQILTDLVSRAGVVHEGMVRGMRVWGGSIHLPDVVEETRGTLRPSSRASSVGPRT